MYPRHVIMAQNGSQRASGATGELPTPAGPACDRGNKCPRVLGRVDQGNEKPPGGPGGSVEPGLELPVLVLLLDA